MDMTNRRQYVAIWQTHGLFARNKRIESNMNLSHANFDAMLTSNCATQDHAVAHLHTIGIWTSNVGPGLPDVSHARLDKRQPDLRAGGARKLKINLEAPVRVAARLGQAIILANMSEWSKVPVSKTGGEQSPAGSNPAIGAKSCSSLRSEHDFFANRLIKS